MTGTQRALDLEEAALEVQKDRGEPLAEGSPWTTVSAWPASARGADLVDLEPDGRLGHGLIHFVDVTVIDVRGVDESHLGQSHIQEDTPPVHRQDRAAHAATDPGCFFGADTRFLAHLQSQIL
ncbi:hypothetical protein ABZX75_05015 [Streptomyces sp. NPDC003038]|uniref:hypothetical protein n=1 Tax=unclassified Streptomyces TaxID=2593676 RepID=UPI0033A2DABC